MKPGDIVKPNHKGEDVGRTGRILDYTVYKGVVVHGPYEARPGKPQVEVKWFGRGRLEMPRCYFVDDLTVLTR